MDIDLLSKMVKELILDNDRVVLPGFGCFVAEIVPASFSDKGYTINPPYRKLYFRAKPDDGTLLVDFYVKSNNVEYELAEKIISDFLAELKTVIFSRKVVVFPGLGRLRATKENNLFFVADEELDIYPSGFGLEPVSLKTHQETRAEVKAVVAGLKGILVDEPLRNDESLKTEEPVKEEVSVCVVEADAVADHDTAVESEPIFEPIEEPQEETVSETVPETLAGPDSEQEPKTAPIHEVRPEKKKRNKALRCFWVILAVFAVLITAYVAIGRLCPVWIDQFLYSTEELEILNK